MSGPAGGSARALVASVAGPVAKVGAVVLLVLLVFTARVVLQSRAELRDGEVKADDGRWREAVEALGRAARLHAPGNPYSRAALDRLESMAAAAEARGRRDDALDAFREVRSALRATRSLLPRDPERARRADQHIAARMAALEPPRDGGQAGQGDPAGPASGEASRAAWHAARLAEDDAPSVGYSLLALLGLALWVGGAFLLLSRGLDDRLRPVPGRALLCGALVAAGFALFLVGLARA